MGITGFNDLATINAPSSDYSMHQKSPVEYYIWSKNCTELKAAWVLKVLQARLNGQGLLRNVGPQEPYCISTLHGGHSGSEAGMTII